MIDKFAQRFSQFWTAGFGAATYAAFLWGLASLFGAGLDAMVVAVVAMTFWILLLLIARRVLVSRGSRSIASALVGGSQAAQQWSVALDRVQTVFYPRDLRFPAVLGDAADTKTAEAIRTTLASALDTAEDQVAMWYMPVQALVWGLPAIGFFGMAWHMRNVLRLALGAQAQVREATDIAPLAQSVEEALTVVSVALLLTVVVHVAVTLGMRKEVHILQTFRTRVIKSSSRATERSRS